MKRIILDRRTLLRGTLGGFAAGIALPTLDAMFTSDLAQAQENRPKRLGLWMWGNGVKMPQWRPTSTGPDWTPNTSTEPLADPAIKDWVNIVTGFDVKVARDRDHHSGLAGLFSGSPVLPQPPGNANYRSTYREPTLDQQLRTEINPDTAFPSLELGVSDRVARGEGTTTTYLSHNGPDSFNAAEYDARVLFERIFGDAAASDAPAPVNDQTSALRRSVLDAVKTDITRLNGLVGAQDKARLEQHLTHIRSIEQRIEAGENGVVSAACMNPQRPEPIEEEGRRENVSQRNEVMSDLLTLALACDRTRIWSVHFSGSFGFTNYWQADEAITSGHHDLTHNEGGDQPQVQKCTTFIMAQLAYLLKRLKETPDSDGRTLLENMVILASSDVSDGLRHTLDDYPVVVAGGGSGFLKTPAIHLQGDGENTSNVLLTVMRAAGSNVDSVGTLDGVSNTPCSEIEA